MDNDTKRLVSNAMSEPWPWRTHTNPLLIAVLLYTLGVAVHGFVYSLGLSVLPVIVIAVGVAAGGLVRAAMRHVKPVALAYAFAVAAGAVTWIAYASQTQTFDITDMGSTGTNAAILFSSAAVLYAVYTWLLVDARRHDEHFAAADRAEHAEYLAAERLEATTPAHPIEAALNEVGLKGIGYAGTDSDDDADTHRLTLSASGDLIEQIAAKAPRLELALRAPYPGAITIYPGPSVADVLMRVARRDVLAREVPFEDLGPSTVHTPQPVARAEDGTRADLPIAGHTGLVYGKRKGGKSTFLMVVIARLIACVDTIVIVIDPKGAPLIAPFLRPYADGRTTKPVLYMVASTVDEANIIAQALEELGERRTRTLLDDDKIHTNPRQPHVIVVIDETDDITGANGTAEARKRITRVVRKYRAAGIDAILASQRGTSSMTGGKDLTSQAGWTALFTVRDKSEVWTTMNKTGIPVDVTRFVHAGTMLLDIDGEQTASMAARSARIDFATVTKLAERYAPMRPDPDADIAELFAKYGIDKWWTDTTKTAGSLLARLRGENVAAIDITHSSPTAARDVPDVLRDMATLVGGDDAITTAALVEGLVELGYDIDGDTVAQRGFSLRGLLYDALADLPDDVRPGSEQLGGQGNPRGYKRAAIEAAIAAYGPAGSDGEPATGLDDIAGVSGSSPAA